MPCPTTRFTSSDSGTSTFGMTSPRRLMGITFLPYGYRLMPTTNNNAPSPWAIRSVANFRYFMREGGLGLLLVVIFGITAFIQHVYDAVFQFPPDWLPVLRLMLPLVAFTTWTTVRVWMFKS